jgi:hypothetical protein
VVVNCAGGSAGVAGLTIAAASSVRPARGEDHAARAVVETRYSAIKVSFCGMNRELIGEDCEHPEIWTAAIGRSSML